MEHSTSQHKRKANHLIKLRFSLLNFDAVDRMAFIIQFKKNNIEESSIESENIGGNMARLLAIPEIMPFDQENNQQ